MQHLNGGKEFGRDHHPRRRRGQRGNATVEMGLIILPMFAMFFITVDLCMVLFLRTTFQHAVREGARYAITSRTMSGMGHDASIKTQVRQSAMGFLNGAENDPLIIIRYYDPITLTETASNSAGNIAEVSVENFVYKPMAPFWHQGDPVNLTVRASDRMEGQPSGPPAR